MSDDDILGEQNYLLQNATYEGKFGWYHKEAREKQRQREVNNYGLMEDFETDKKKKSNDVELEMDGIEPNVFEKDDELSGLTPLEILINKKKVIINSNYVLRGMAIFYSILIINQNLLGYKTFPPFSLGGWNKISPADCAFPVILFLLGMNIPFAFHNWDQTYISTRSKLLLFLHLVLKAVLLIGVGVLFNFTMNQQLYPKFIYVETFHLPGYLQTLGIVYIVWAGFYIISVENFQRFLCLCFIAAYNAVLYGVELNRCENKKLLEDCNAFRRIDNEIFGINYVAQPNDPNGIFSTLNCFVACYIGVESGQILMDLRQRVRDTYLSGVEMSYEMYQLHTVGKLVVMGVLATLAAIVLYTFEPFNATLYTTSYLLLSTGIALLLFAALYYILDVPAGLAQHRTVKKGVMYLFAPFYWWGRHALTLFLLNGLALLLLNFLIFVEYKNLQVPVYYYIYIHIFEKVNDQWGILLYSIGYSLIYTLIAFGLHKAGIVQSNILFFKGLVFGGKNTKENAIDDEDTFVIKNDKFI